jgi:hypothetical protein
MKTHHTRQSLVPRQHMLEHQQRLYEVERPIRQEVSRNVMTLHLQVGHIESLNETCVNTDRSELTACQAASRLCWWVSTSRAIRCGSCSAPHIATR